MARQKSSRKRKNSNILKSIIFTILTITGLACYSYHLSYQIKQLKEDVTTLEFQKELLIEANKSLQKEIEQLSSETTQ